MRFDFYKKLLDKLGGLLSPHISGDAPAEDNAVEDNVIMDRPPYPSRSLSGAVVPQGLTVSTTNEGVSSELFRVTGKEAPARKVNTFLLLFPYNVESTNNRIYTIISNICNNDNADVANIVYVYNMQAKSVLDLSEKVESLGIASAINENNHEVVLKAFNYAYATDGNVYIVTGDDLPSSVFKQIRQTQELPLTPMNDLWLHLENSLDERRLSYAFGYTKKKGNPISILTLPNNPSTELEDFEPWHLSS